MSLPSAVLGKLLMMSLLLSKFPKFEDELYDPMLSIS